jgi:hypothetical protein
MLNSLIAAPWRGAQIFRTRWLHGGWQIFLVPLPWWGCSLRVLDRYEMASPPHVLKTRNLIDGISFKLPIETWLERHDVWRFFFLKVGVGLVPKRGCLLTLAYYAFPTWYEFGERRWNDILTGENRRTRRKTCPISTLSTTNPTWIDQGFRGERPAANGLSHGTTHVWS